MSLSARRVSGAGTRRRRPVPLSVVMRAWGAGSCSGDEEREDVYEGTRVMVVAPVSALPAESWRAWYVVRLPAVLGREGMVGTGGYSSL